jgi:hypothetical protein
MDPTRGPLNRAAKGLDPFHLTAPFGVEGTAGISDSASAVKRSRTRDGSAWFLAPLLTEAHHERPEGGAAPSERHAGLAPVSRHTVAAAAEQDGQVGALGGRDEQGGWWPDKRGIAIRVRELPDLAEALAQALDLAAGQQAPRPSGPEPRPRRDRPASPAPPPPVRLGGGEFSEFSAFSRAGPDGSPRSPSHRQSHRTPPRLTNRKNSSNLATASLIEQARG